MKNIIILPILAFMSFAVQASNQFLKEPVFQVGEKAKYNVYYNLGFIWIHAGDVDFSVSKKVLNGKDTYSLSVSGYTTKTFDKFYTIRDTFESFIDPESMLPLYYREMKHEDSYHSQLKYVYSESDDSLVIKLDRYKRQKKYSDTVTVSKSTSDLIASCYKIRNLDVSDIKQNDKVPFSMIFDDEVYTLGLKFMGRKKIKLKNGKKYNALKFVPTLITGDLFEKEDDMAVYVSDDDNHVPLLIEAKIKVGSVKAMLSSVENNKYPMSALIK